MDAEHERVIGRLREIYRRARRFEVTVGGHKLTITATERVELAFASDAEISVRKLTDSIIGSADERLD